jgi:hypothetical protein
MLLHQGRKCAVQTKTQDALVTWTPRRRNTQPDAERSVKEGWNVKRPHINSSINYASLLAKMKNSIVTVTAGRTYKVWIGSRFSVGLKQQWQLQPHQPQIQRMEQIERIFWPSYEYSLPAASLIKRIFFSHLSI